MRTAAISGATSGPTVARGLGSGRWASDAGGRARAACMVAATAIAAKPQRVPVARPISMTMVQLPANPSGPAMYSRSISQQAVPTRKPMPKKLAEDTARSA
ncbi:hypothetical protein STVA_51380 [Allostella vacuolata]|nr:hypothetical protein STVA_51380 [Stella vacuolata]